MKLKLQLPKPKIKEIHRLKYLTTENTPEIPKKMRHEADFEIQSDILT